MSSLEKSIGEKFDKYCRECGGLCCRCREATFFGWELNKIPTEKVNLSKLDTNWNILKKTKDSNIRRVAINKICAFSDGSQCNLGEELNPLDCLSFPVYPIFNFKEEKKIKKWIVHKNCPFFKEISKDKEAVNLVKKLWKTRLKNVEITNDILKKWYGEWKEEDKEYWHDQNLLDIN